MITVPRSLIRRLRVVFSRALGLSSRSSGPAVQFRSNGVGLSVRILNEQVAVEYRESGSRPEHAVAAPFELLKRVESNKGDALTIGRVDEDRGLAEWTDSRIPKSERFTLEPFDEFPMPPDRMASNPSKLLDALRDAMETAAPEAARYALNRLRLRGSDGQIAATDGRQLLVQSGFSFPWDGESLVLPNRLFASPELRTSENVEIGATDDWLTLRSGPWTAWFRSEKDARYPRIEDVYEPLRSPCSTLDLSESDGEFLAQVVKDLPTSDDFNLPVTVDLNGKVVIRSQAGKDAKPTEIVLAGSRRLGEPVRFVTNRELLARAVRMGFRRLEIFAPGSPLRCDRENRCYVWMPIGEAAALKADPAAVRIASAPPEAEPNPRIDPRPSPARSAPPCHERHETVRPSAASTVDATNSSNERICESMSEPQSRNGQAADNGSPEKSVEQQNDVELLEAAENLKVSLREAQSQLSSLIAGLKRQRQQSKRLRSAVQSLKQLQALDV